jgi:type IV pilus assembly protein PilB
MTSNSQTRLIGLPMRLVTDGLVSEAQAREAVDFAQQKKVPFVSVIADKKWLPDLQIAIAASEEFGVPLLDLAALDLESIQPDLVNEKIIQTHHVLPLMSRGNTIHVAVSDPTAVTALDEITFQTGLNAEPVVVEYSKLAALIEAMLEKLDTTMGDLGDADLDNLEVAEDETAKADESGGSNADDAPVVRFVHKILLDAISRGASDIHFEPYEKSYRVRYRQDGMLREVASPPVGLGGRIAARLKVMSRLDIAERRMPQDGRMKLNLSRNRSIDFRINTLPTVYGEKIVMRILDADSAKWGVEALGFSEKQKDLFMGAIEKPYGLVLVTGPTGSGKTVTLYTGLNILNTVERNISTAEDPVEIQVMGINQVNVSPKTGFTFASALRAFLRQDPDIIMVGEIRDLETAEISIKAAQTGHLVLSTLHTNDAPQTITRLANMGIPPFNIASSINLIIAQRLARRLCTVCKIEDPLDDRAKIKAGFKPDEVAGLTIHRANPDGCNKCTKGYKGRAGLFQMLPISEEMERMILNGANSQELAEQATSEGHDDLRRAGLIKVIQGMTSLEEVSRVTTE